MVGVILNLFYIFL